MSCFSLSGVSPGVAIDIVCAVVLAVSIVVGAVRGVSGQAARLAGFAAGLAAIGVVNAPIRDAFFGDASRSGSILALALAVVVGVIAAFAVRAAVSRFLRLVVSQPADAVIGGALSALVAGAVLSIVLSILCALPIEPLRKTILDESASGRIATEISAKLVGFSSDFAK